MITTTTNTTSTMATVAPELSLLLFFTTDGPAAPGLAKSKHIKKMISAFNLRGLGVQFRSRANWTQRCEEFAITTTTLKR